MINTAISIIQSRPVSFIVGDSETEYVLHTGVVARLSKPLDVLVNGAMKEAREGRVEWPDVDGETFVRFSQWAYTGTYLAAEPDIVLYPSDITTEQANDTTAFRGPGSEVPAAVEASPKQPVTQDATTDQTPYVLARLQADPAVPKTCRQGHASGFDSATQGTCSSCSKEFLVPTCSHKWGGRKCRLPQFTACLNCRERYSTTKKCQMAMKFKYPAPGRTFQTRPNREAAEDYSGVFFSHAKLYVVADIYDIPLLGKQTLHNLATTLQSFTLYKSRICDVVSLVEYVFNNTQKRDAMRDLLVHYAACAIEKLSEDDGFQKFLESCPEFASALIAKMIERLD